MNKKEAIIRPERFTAVNDALAEAGFVGLNTKMPMALNNLSWRPPSQ